MKILVTGGSGFIGSHLVDKLLEKNHEVTIYDISEPKYESNSNFIKGDILSLEQLKEATQGIDIIYHLAAEADVERMYKAPIYSTILNTIGTLNVLESAKINKCKRVIFASTEWVYGSCKDKIVDEESRLYPPHQDHIYTSSKIAAEMYIQNYHDLYGVDYTIMRFGIPFGPRARSSTVTYKFLKKALSGQPITIYGSGEQFRQFVFVEDLAEGCVACLKSEAINQIINLEGKESISIKMIAETIKKLLDKDLKIELIKKREGDFKGKIVSAEKAKQLLKWEPRYNYESAMNKYIGWFKKNERY
jgi:UDP-glucose 4-epimerase